MKALIGYGVGEAIQAADDGYCIVTGALNMH